MEVKGSEPQGRGQPRGWVRKKRGAKARADGQEPDKKRRERWTSGRLTAKSISIKNAGRKSGGCALTAVELTSGGLRRCRPCPLWSDWRLGGEPPNAAQESAGGIVGLGEAAARRGQDRSAG